MSEGFDPKKLDAELKRKLEEAERQRAAAAPAESPPDPLDIPEDANRNDDEHTPKEWREKLRGLITSAKEKLGMSERGERAKTYLAERSGALTEKAKGLGPIPEKVIRSLGERYNKLNWKYKLAISAGLIAGVGFSAVGSIPALIAGYGLVAQRGAGMAGMFVKFENHLQKTAEGKADGYWAKKEWYKKLAEKPGWQRKAMAGVMAIGYTGLMSFGIHEAIGAIRGDESWGGQLHEWVKSHWPLGGSAGVHPDAIPSPTESLSTEGHGAGSAAPESSTSETAPEVADTDPGSAIAPDAPEATDADTESAAAQTDLSAQEWRAEYAESGQHTGAPDWRAEHTEADFAPETPAEMPAPADTAPPAPTAEEAAATSDTTSSDTPGEFYDVQPQPPIEDATTLPPQPEASPAPAPETSHFIVNAHGISVDPDHANSYLDVQGNHIIYGGSLDERAELAKQWVAKDHSSAVFFDSTRPEKFLGFFEREVPHLSMARWVDAGGESGVRIAEDTPDASLVGIMRPNINDLAQVYKPN